MREMGEVREEVGERKTKSEAMGETKNGEVRVGVIQVERNRPRRGS